MADPKTQTACEENPKVGFGAYIALALAIIIFSGVFYKMPDAYKCTSWRTVFKVPPN